MGLKVEEFDAVPSKLNAEQRRWYFDSRQTGKSNRGHDFPSSLEESQKIDLLEYLKYTVGNVVLVDFLFLRRHEGAEFVE